MSFDIHLLAFEDGRPAARPAAPARRLVADAPGLAEIHGLPDADETLSSLMFTHVLDEGFDLAARVATALDMVILPVGCPTCIVSEDQRPHLPAELGGGPIALIRSGQDLLRVVKEDDG